jgi:hypothetical protein
MEDVAGAKGMRRSYNRYACSDLFQHKRRRAAREDKGFTGNKTCSRQEHERIAVIGLLILTMAALMISPVNDAQAEQTHKQQARAKIRTTATETLSRLYMIHPRASRLGELP